MRRTYYIVAIILTTLLVATTLQGSSERAVRYRARAVKSYPHYQKAYTQGLFFHEGRLYESSGQYGESFFHEVEINSGRSLRSFNLESHYFGEGAVELNGKIYLLTWMENDVLVYDLKSFRQLGKLYNPREGWGITTDGERLILSDGGSKLYFHNPLTFSQLGSVEVTLNGKSLSLINELEYIKGEVWANLYGSEDVVIIDPTTGVVKGVVDCSQLYPVGRRLPNVDVLNGIAYDKVSDKIYLTGKYWPRLYQIELIEQ